MDKNYVVNVIVSIGLIIAVISLLISVFAAIGNRFQWFYFITGLKILGISAIVAILAAAVSVIGIIIAASVLATPKNIIIGIVTLVISIPVAAIPLYMRYEVKMPYIHDITTDMVNPPPFVSILPLRKDAVNPSEYGGAEIAEQQTQAYPDIKTLTISSSPQQAFSKALDVAKKMNWQIIATDSAAGRIEATATTLWMGYKDDIVIRITGKDNLCNVDIRSVSRVGKGDFGANAGRIRKFLSGMQE